MLTILGCINRVTDLRLVALAACICAIACFTSLTLTMRARDARDDAAGWGWLAAAASVFGGGVWSMHFVAMLAFMPATPIAYDIPITAFSMVIGSLGALMAFAVWNWAPSAAVRGVFGGSLLGLAIAAMHYTGVAAMRLPGRIRFDGPEIVISLAAGIAFGIVAFLRYDRQCSLKRRIEVAAWMAVSICVLHFTGMHAMSLELGTAVGLGDSVLGSGALAVAVGSVSLAIMVISLAATLMEQHLSSRTLMELSRIRLLSSLSHEVMMICRDGIILEVNDAGGRLFGVAATALVGRASSSLFPDAEQPAAICWGQDAGKHTDPDDLRQEEVTVVSDSGALLPVEFSCSPIEYEGKPALAITLRDLSDRKHDEERLRHLAHHDPLTDLPNRAYLRDRLGRALANAGANGGQIALLYLDLDRFKPVNDLFGHQTGDALLIQVARRLRQQLRSSDLLARVGGDEFVIVSDMIADPENAAILGGRLVKSLSEPFEIDGQSLEIGVSVGIAVSPRDGDTEEALLHAADTALYRAKNDRRGAFRFFEPAMNEGVQARRKLELDIRHALDRDEFELHYQPITHCGSGDIAGFEALIRWHHPERGLVSPLEFIPLAEDTGQIGEIGRWVIETACAAATSWPTHCFIAVNVSPIQFRQSNLPSIVAAALSASGLAPERLEIEVTEGVFIDDVTLAVDTLSALRAQGVRLSLDDFGTGYSSLSYLRSFVFNTIKIDRSFITGLGEDAGSEMIVRTIIGLGHNLGLSVTAEGIETALQREMLKAEGCDHLQGYLLGRPTPVGAIPALQRRSAEMAA